MIKMKILWFTNIPLPQMLGNNLDNHSTSGGWMVALLDHLTGLSDINISVACVSPDLNEHYIQASENIQFHPIRQGSYRRVFAFKNQDNDSRYLKKCIKLVREVKPDIVHVFGTERFYGLISTGVQPYIPVVISIQGLLHEYVRWRNYFGIATLRDIILMHDFAHLVRGIGPIPTYIHYRKAAKRELEILKTNRWFMGRTYWDRAHLLAINPVAQYFHVEELLRENFYRVQWSISRCSKHRIIFTNANSTNRGIETLLNAVAILKEDFLDIKLVLAGGVEQLPYGKRLKYRISKLGLEGMVEYLGRINAGQMASELEKANVFVIASFLENSPNSLCEAQLVGLPTVASYTGGIPSLVEEGVTGLFFPPGDAAVLAAKIKEIFTNNILAEKLGQNARDVALARHNPESVGNAVLNAYRSIISVTRT